jgi:phosphoribosylglycinamide formyltransferase 1
LIRFIFKGRIIVAISQKSKAFALFASGSGSNAEVLAKHALKHGYPLKCLVTDRADAPVIEKMQKLGVTTLVISPSLEKEGRKQKHEEEILERLKSFDISWAFLAGYMRILGPTFLNYFKNSDEGIYQIVNIHPSLLPSFPGRTGYQDAFSYGVKTSGITVHLVDEGVDSGPILAQASFERKQDDQFKDFQQRGLALEHSLFPQVLDWIMQGRIKLENYDQRKVGWEIEHE